MPSDNEVGYGKPPARNQFRKGVSGNPKGRPKGSKNLATVLAEKLQEKIVIDDNGRPRTVSKLDASIARLVDKAAAGDPAALRQLIPLIGAAEGQAPITADETLGVADAKVMETVLKRFKSYSQENNNDENSQK